MVPTAAILDSLFITASQVEKANPNNVDALVVSFDILRRVYAAKGDHLNEVRNSSPFLTLQTFSSI